MEFRTALDLIDACSCLAGSDLTLWVGMGRERYKVYGIFPRGMTPTGLFADRDTLKDWRFDGELLEERGVLIKREISFDLRIEEVRKTPGVYVPIKGRQRLRPMLEVDVRLLS